MAVDRAGDGEALGDDTGERRLGADCGVAAGPGDASVKRPIELVRGGDVTGGSCVLTVEAAWADGFDAVLEATVAELRVLVDGDRAGGVGDVGNCVAEGPREAAGVLGSEPTNVVRDGVNGRRAVEQVVLVVLLALAVLAVLARGAVAEEDVAGGAEWVLDDDDAEAWTDEP